MSVTIENGTQVIPVSKQDLITAWSVLEKLVVSLHKMGSYHSTSGPDVPMTPEQRQQMLDDLDAYLSPELMRELAKARRALVEYLPSEETEAISDTLDYWRR